jgi:hypothetical protein
MSNFTTRSKTHAPISVVAEFPPRYFGAWLLHLKLASRLFLRTGSFTPRSDRSFPGIQKLLSGTAQERKSCAKPNTLGGVFATLSIATPPDLSWVWSSYVLGARDYRQAPTPLRSASCRATHRSLQAGLAAGRGGHVARRLAKIHRVRGGA